MRLRAFSLYDNKTGAYGLPFFSHHVGAAIRMCIDVASTLDNNVGKYPHDFSLIEIGGFDDQVGCFLPEHPSNHGTVGGMLDAARRQQRSLALFDRVDTVQGALVNGEAQSVEERI